MSRAEGRPAVDEFLVAGLLFVMVLLNFLGVIARYWIHLSLPWLGELQEILFVWMVFLGAGLTITRRMHIGFAPLAERLPRRAPAAIAPLGPLAFIGFFVLLLWRGGTSVHSEITFNQRTPTLGWPEWVVAIALPVGALVALVRLGRLGAGALRRRR
jgi:TRAP-type C4-dicarboxylate transport system permease small subunit